jgi:hypothetical protein
MSEKQMRIRGPKGTTKDSRIVVHVTGNPKTPDDPTHELWGFYEKYPTLELLTRVMHALGKRDKVLKMLTLDARRGYISLEGYEKNRIPFVAYMGTPTAFTSEFGPAPGHVLLHGLGQDCTEGVATPVGT